MVNLHFDPHIYHLNTFLKHLAPKETYKVLALAAIASIWLAANPFIIHPSLWQPAVSSLAEFILF